MYNVIRIKNEIDNVAVFVAFHHNLMDGVHLFISTWNMRKHTHTHTDVIFFESGIV